LQEQHPDKTIRVFNAAVSGFTTAQEYLFYLSTVRKLSPDLVILFDGYNDAFCYSPGSKAEYRWDIDRRAWEMHPWKTDPIRVWGTRLMGASYTLFYLGKLSFDFGRRINESTRSKRLNYSGDVDRKGLRTYYMENLQGYRTCVRDTVKRYTIFAKTAGVDGVNILFTSQPILTLKPHKTDNERACYNLLLQGLRVRRDEQVPYFDYYEDFLATMRSWAVQNDQDYIDFQNVVNQKADEIFVDYCHLSFAGNRLVAETLARFINAHHLAGKGGTTTITGSPHVVNGSVN
jgi:hypothetical protein